ncbi:fused MFS/spermidine synthase [Chondromyces apiculatus]|uniref:Spermidine synthase n=1 Tax=Chondromyces apiculatus DSM 436 TaxID=1192034 RepID=A0A017THX8_9BACT|nr:fused MFS/spermidine synthase [Chondromyces apiculatus]EYF08440.1 Hypothetical protein CAP_3969 [Chondromyces apiculatus DSM 436]
MRILFTAAIALGAALLFCVQPMLGKALLPLLGGAAQVWVTCMLFFQAALLAGYAYAHLATARLDIRRHAPLHLVLALLPFILVAPGSRLGLPFSLPLDRAPEGDPTLGVLLLLATTAGLPFFIVGATSPLLQRWFSGTDDPAARDPYFLYSASNLGSLAALLGYPLLLEPRLGLAAQSRGWAWGYALFVALLAACALLAARRRSAASLVPAPEALAPAAPTDAPADAPPAAPAASSLTAPLSPAPTLITSRRYLRWIALAFVPSSHLLGVTAYLTADIAPVPLLWVLPLALYLVSFILVFARRPLLPHAWMVRLLPLGAAASLLTLLAEASNPAALLLPMHLITFFAGAMVCHGELARDRPERRHLTAFYLCLSVGGALGGLFNAVFAPLFFTSLVEYPLAILLACLCRPAPPRAPAETASSTLSPETSPRPSAPPDISAAASPKPSALHDWRPDLRFAARAFLLTVALILGVRYLGRPHDRVTVAIVYCLPLLLVYRTLHQPRRFALSLAGIALASAFHPGGHGTDLYRERTFFGIVRVTQDTRGFHRLVHGRTMHGIQNPARRTEPLAYYTRSSPIGRAFTHLDRAAALDATIGVVGLGSGALAAYARPGQQWTFYELDPAMVRIARDDRYFTFLSDAFPGGHGLHTVLGDARLRLAEAPDGHFDLLVLDAFSSDAIPVHLLTREALALYQRKLAPHGVIAFHLSNRFLDLFAVLAALVPDAGLTACAFQDFPSTEEELAGKTPSQWAMVARHRDDLEELPADPEAITLKPRPGVAIWTDEFSDLLAILRR